MIIYYYTYHITFLELHGDECSLGTNNLYLVVVLELLGIDIKNMHYTLCCCIIKATNKSIVKIFSIEFTTKPDFSLSTLELS